MDAPLPINFAITGSRLGANATMELHGELDLAVAPRVFAEFDKLLTTDPAAVIVDLRELSFMDVRGLRALIALRSVCEEQGRRFVLVRGQPAVHRLLALCDLKRTFELVDSVAEAREPTGATDRSPAGTDTNLHARRPLGFTDCRRRATAPSMVPRRGSDEHLHRS